MSKPFPCCGCGCINCPQYGVSDNWTFEFSGMTGPDPLSGYILLVSTTGNELDDDLNALGPISFAFTSVTGTTIKVVVATVSPFPGKQWIYGDTGGGGTETVFNVRIRIEVWDDCGKVYVRSIRIISETSLTSGLDVTRWQATRSSGPGSTNCGSNITSGTSITQSGIGYLELVGTVTLDPP